MPTPRKTLYDRPLMVGAGVLLLAMVGSGVGITAALKLRDRDAVVSAPVAAAVRAPAPASGELADMVATVVPAVVQVQVTGLRHRTPGVITPDGTDSLRRFYDDAPQGEEPDADEVLGSGFIVDSKGLVVTNAHVVEGGSKIRVRLASGREVAAELVGADSKTDLAVLRIASDAGGLPTVNWGDSDKVRVGDAIFAVGSPFGLGSTVTSGIVSGRGREIGEGPYDDFLQIDAAINQGNSGGPLFDRYGHVIGVNTAIYSPSDSGGNVGIGFAIPAHMVQQVVRQLVTNGHVIRGQIGISIQPVTEDIADSMGLKEARGALVAGVTPDSPAARGGVRIGDVITRFGGAPVVNARDLTRLVAESTIGEVRPVEVLRNGQLVKLQVATMSAERPVLAAAPVALPSAATKGGSADILGLVVTRTTPELNARAEQPARATGLMITRVDPTSGGYDRGLEVGDLIIAANHLRVNSPEQLKAGVAAAGRAGRHNILLEVLRGDEHAFVAVPLS